MQIFVPTKSKIVYFRDLVGHCQGARIQGVTFNDVVDLMTPWQCLEDQKPFRCSGGGGEGRVVDPGWPHCHGMRSHRRELGQFPLNPSKYDIIALRLIS